VIQKLSEEDQATKTLSAISPSHQGRLGYLIHPASNIPRGFRIPIPRDEWSKAIFVPGNIACRSRSDSYPSRIYILTHDLLAVFGPAEGNECSFVVKLCDLIELRSQKEPRSGAIVFVMNNPSRSFRYCPVQHQCIDSFLMGLRSRWLRSDRVEPRNVAWPREAAELSLSCRFVLDNELDPDESIIGMLVQSKKSQKRGWALYNPIPCLETSCLTLTDRRLVWLNCTEFAGARTSSVTVRYTPRKCIIGASAVPGQSCSQSFELTVHLKTEQLWRLSVEQQGESLLEALLKELQC
jgi:hypothetical protein